MCVVEPSHSRRSSSGAVDGVGEAQNRTADAGDACADDELVVVARGRLVARRGFDDGDHAAFLLLHGFVVEAHGADEFDAADFKPDEVVGVVDDAHLVGFGIAHADAGF